LAIRFPSLSGVSSYFIALPALAPTCITSPCVHMHIALSGGECRVCSNLRARGSAGMSIHRNALLFWANAKVMQILQCCNDAMPRRTRRHERDEESPAFAGLSSDFNSALIRMLSAIRGRLCA
jgi:hypothetical protein